MQELWHRPIVLMMVLAGAYFAVRTNRVFSQNLHNDTDVSFLFNRCGKPLRRAYAAGILMQAGESICFPFMIMLRMAIAAGGAGAIVWFAVFSLLLKCVQGAMGALGTYYGRAGSTAALVICSAKREGIGTGKNGAAVMLGIQASFAALGLAAAAYALCGSARHGSGSIIFYAAVCMAAAALPIIKRGTAIFIGAGAAFAVFIIAALLKNAANIMLILKIMLTDAVQLGRIVFEYSGMGLGACMGAGACLSAGLFLLNAYSAGENADMFPHPIYAAVYYQLRWSAAVITAFVVGMLMLCFELEADANETTKAIMAAFVCFFGTRQLICAIRRLWKDMRISRAVCIAAGVAALITVLNKSALSAALNVIACAGMAGHIIYALSDSGWYFALMEDYRDRYVWHSIPHPDLMAEKEQDAGNGDI